MKKFLPFLIYPALGMLAGWASVAVTSSGKNEKPLPETTRSTGSDHETRPPWTGEDFYQMALKRTERFHDRSSSPWKELLGDWSIAEIHAALDEALADPRTLLQNGGTAGILLREYMARDLDAALVWFSTLPAIHKANLALTLSHAWPEDQAMEGLAFIREHNDLFGRSASPPWSIVSKCIAETAADGPAAVAAFLKQLQSEGFGLNFGNPIAFPAGFDFAELLESDDFHGLGLTEMKNSMIVAWRDRDRELALDWVLQSGGDGDLLALAGYSQNQAGDTIPWLAGNLDRATPEQRGSLIGQMTRRWLDGGGGEATRWIENAPTPDLKAELRAAATQGLFCGRASPAIGVVEKIPETDERLRFLETLTLSESVRNRSQPLNADNESLLRRKLEEWGADPTRADAIINRYKKPPTP